MSGHNWMIDVLLVLLGAKFGAIVAMLWLYRQLSTGKRVVRPRHWP